MIGGFERHLLTGLVLADIPKRHGPPETCYNCFVRRWKLGVWGRIIETASRAYDGDLRIIDSSSRRLHQHAASVEEGAGTKRGVDGAEMLNLAEEAVKVGS